MVNGGTGLAGLTGLNGGADAVTDGGAIASVIIVGGWTEEIETNGLVNETRDAVLLTKLALTCGDLLHEFIGSDGLPWLEDVGDNFAQGIVIDGSGLVLMGRRSLVREVITTDVEAEFAVVGVMTQVVAADVAHSCDFSLRGKREDVCCIDEELLAKISCGTSLFAEMVVTDEKEGCVGVIDCVTHYTAELCGNIDATVWHEMVDIVDDDELRLALFDETLDASGDTPDIVALTTEDVETDEMEILLVGHMGSELAADGGTDMGTVDGVYP